MKVCVVGAGVAGLQTAQVLEGDWHEVTVFDKAEGPGGVWRENYDGYALQVPNELYEFVVPPEVMARPELDSTFPSGQATQDYIEKFIAVTNLAKTCSLKYGEAVMKIKKQVTSGPNMWSVTTSKGSYAFDYVVICTGMYHLAQTPKFVTDFAAAKGANSCTLMHSSELLDAAKSVSEKKHVAVVGGGKSAIDVAVACAKAGVNTTLLMREMHWPVPRKILFLVPFQWGTYSRLGHFLLPPHWRLTGKIEAFMHALIAPVKFLVWRLLEFVFAWQFGLFQFTKCTNVKGNAFPKAKMEIDLFNGGQILTYEFRDMLLKPKKDKAFGDLKMVVAKDCAGALKELEGVDCIVSATGFKKSYDMFSTDVLEKLDLQGDGLWLYKNVIPANVEGLAFVGSEVSTFNNILSQFVQAKWLSFWLAKSAGEKVSADKMAQYVEKEKAWKRSWMHETCHRASLTQLHMTRYHDVLLENFLDLDANRLPRSKWFEWLIPLTARDFAFLQAVRPPRCSPMSGASTAVPTPESGNTLEPSEAGTTD